MNPQPISKLRYAQVPQLSGARLLQANFYKEFIDVYGIEGIYFKSNAYNNFFNNAPLSSNISYDANLSGNYIYGENYPLDGTGNYALTYVSSATIPMHIQMNADAVILNQYGINPDQQATVTFMINEFNLAFPTPRSTETLIFDNISFYVPIVSGMVSSNISSSTNKIYFTCTESSNKLILTLSSSIDPSSFILDYAPSGYTATGYIPITAFNTYDAVGIVSGVRSIGVSEDTRYYQPLQYSVNIEKLSIYHQELSASYCSGNLYSLVSGLELSSVSSYIHGYLTGSISGNMLFNSLSNFNDFKARVTPVVGDYIRLPFFNDNIEEWEITNVTDRNLTNDGINPFMDKYIWSCDVVRRRYSHEDNLVSANDMETLVSGNTNLLSSLMDNLDQASNEGIFDYTNEYTSNVGSRTHIDRIYGRY